MNMRSSNARYSAELAGAGRIWRLDLHARLVLGEGPPIGQAGACDLLHVCTLSLAQGAGQG
jgi:hypothetical protein